MPPTAIPVGRGPTPHGTRLPPGSAQVQTRHYASEPKGRGVTSKFTESFGGKNSAANNSQQPKQAAGRGAPNAAGAPGQGRGAGRGSAPSARSPPSAAGRGQQQSAPQQQRQAQAPRQQQQQQQQQQQPQQQQPPVQQSEAGSALPDSAGRGRGVSFLPSENEFLVPRDREQREFAGKFGGRGRAQVQQKTGKDFTRQAPPVSKKDFRRVAGSTAPLVAPAPRPVKKVIAKEELEEFEDTPYGDIDEAYERHQMEMHDQAMQDDSDEYEDQPSLHDEELEEDRFEEEEEEEDDQGDSRENSEQMLEARRRKVEKKLSGKEREKDKIQRMKEKKLVFAPPKRQTTRESRTVDRELGSGMAAPDDSAFFGSRQDGGDFGLGYERDYGREMEEEEEEEDDQEGDGEEVAEYDEEMADEELGEFDEDDYDEAELDDEDFELDDNVFADEEHLSEAKKAYLEEMEGNEYENLPLVPYKLESVMQTEISPAESLAQATSELDLAYLELSQYDNLNAEEQQAIAEYEAQAIRELFRVAEESQKSAASIEAALDEAFSNPALTGDLEEEDLATDLGITPVQNYPIEEVFELQSVYNDPNEVKAYAELSEFVQTMIEMGGTAESSEQMQNFLHVPSSEKREVIAKRIQATRQSVDVLKASLPNLTKAIKDGNASLSENNFNALLVRSAELMTGLPLSQPDTGFIRDDEAEALIDTDQGPSNQKHAAAILARIDPQSEYARNIRQEAFDKTIAKIAQDHGAEVAARISAHYGHVIHHTMENAFADSGLELPPGSAFFGGHWNLPPGTIIEEDAIYYPEDIVTQVGNHEIHTVSAPLASASITDKSTAVDALNSITKDLYRLLVEQERDYNAKVLRNFLLVNPLFSQDESENFLSREAREAANNIAAIAVPDAELTEEEVASALELDDESVELLDASLIERFQSDENYLSSLQELSAFDGNYNLAMLEEDMMQALDEDGDFISDADFEEILAQNPEMKQLMDDPVALLKALEPVVEAEAALASEQEDNEEELEENEEENEIGEAIQTEEVAEEEEDGEHLSLETIEDFSDVVFDEDGYNASLAKLSVDEMLAQITNDMAFLKTDADNRGITLSSPEIVVATDENYEALLADAAEGKISQLSRGFVFEDDELEALPELDEETRAKIQKEVEDELYSGIEKPDSDNVTDPSQPKGEDAKALDGELEEEEQEEEVDDEDLEEDLGLTYDEVARLDIKRLLASPMNKHYELTEEDLIDIELNKGINDETLLQFEPLRSPMVEEIDPEDDDAVAEASGLVEEGEDEEGEEDLDDEDEEGEAYLFDFDEDGDEHVLSIPYGSLDFMTPPPIMIPQVVPYDEMNDEIYAEAKTMLNAGNHRRWKSVQHLRNKLAANATLTTEEKSQKRKEAREKQAKLILDKKINNQKKRPAKTNKKKSFKAHKIVPWRFPILGEPTVAPPVGTQIPEDFYESLFKSIPEENDDAIEEFLRDASVAVEHNAHLKPIEKEKIVRKLNRELQLFKFDNLDKPEIKQSILKMIYSKPKF